MYVPRKGMGGDWAVEQQVMWGNLQAVAKEVRNVTGFSDTDATSLRMGSFHHSTPYLLAHLHIHYLQPREYVWLTGSLQASFA
jgi:hypothetical protein